MNSLYKLICYRYGEKIIEEFSSFEEAKKTYDYLTDSGEAFVEYIVDENNKIILDSKEYVANYEGESEVGKQFQDL